MLHVELRRAGLVETVHPISAAASDGERLLWSVGPDFASFWRSACKPWQLVSSLEQLPDLAGLDEADLAIGASSHSGQPQHLEAVRRVLRHFGLDESGLRCGAHWPMHEPSARAAPEMLVLHNNCSGKHSFMLAATLARGWEPDYRAADHPLQRLNRARIAEAAGVEPGLGVDGCGVPTFHLPLSGMARSWGGLARAFGGGELLGRVGRAMAARPELVSGEGRLDLALARAATEPLVGKVGAEGLFGVALPARGLGLVLKCHSGHGEALAVAVRAVLDEIAPGAVAGDWPWTRVQNVVGAEVGERRAVWS